MILPTKEQLDAMDMEPVKRMFHNVPETKFLTMEAGKEHYRLLRWLSESQTGIVISEVGTYMGLSTVCLAWNKLNPVISYDVDYSVLKWRQRPDNVACIKMPNEPHTFSKSIIQSDVIFIDTSHFGIMEKEVFTYLTGNDWKGILIYDDIYLNDGMKSAWEFIKSQVAVTDATDIGHIYGTGIIEFK